jgi:regulator of replication initiation timing
MRESKAQRRNSANKGNHVWWPRTGYDSPTTGKDLAAKFSRAKTDSIDIGCLSVFYLDLKAENASLRMENQTLRKELENTQTPGSDPESVVDCREISHEQAKKEVDSFFSDHSGETIYPSDVADALNLSYLLVEEIIEELEDEGKIRRSDR